MAIQFFDRFFHTLFKSVARIRPCGNVNIRAFPLPKPFEVRTIGIRF